MATTFKTLLNSDVTTTRTLLHEAIPITGTIASGTYRDPVFEVKSDNAFITHAIPRTEAQYRWIASSIDSGSIPETGKQI